MHGEGRGKVQVIVPVIAWRATAIRTCREFILRLYLDHLSGKRINGLVLPRV